MGKGGAGLQDFDVVMTGSQMMVVRQRIIFVRRREQVTDTLYDML